MAHEYIKLRKNFGRQTLFQAVPGHLVDSIDPDKELQKMYILRNPVHNEAQATLPQSAHECNTKERVTRDTGVDHAEGGWPREVHFENEEHVTRYRRRVQHDENYVEAVMTAYPTLHHHLQQNNAVEIYDTYFTNMPAQEPVEAHYIKLANTFRDPYHRMVSSIVWTNESNSKLAASYYTTETDTGIDWHDNCYIWDIHRESKPLCGLENEMSVWRLAASPVDPEIFVGGMETGIIHIYDIREGSKAVNNSSVYNSHTRSVTALLFINSRTNTEFFSGSPDGECLWWDMRNLSEPTCRLPMSVKLAPKEKPTLLNSEGVSSLQFDKGMPSRFLCGTETGLIINGNRMGKDHSEILTCYWEAHDGPVRAVHRSSCTSRMFISCGDWRVRIWSEEIKTAPILVTEPLRYQVADVCWAPIRYSSYMTICEGGIFSYWDLLRKYQEPVASLKLSDCPLSKLAPHVDCELVAIGDNHGSLYLLQLSESMSVPGPRDKVLMLQVYERETKREHILDNRLKEIHLKKRQEQEAAVDVTEETVVDEEDNLEAEAEEKYFKIVGKLLDDMAVTAD